MQLAASYSWLEALKDSITNWGPWLLLSPLIFVIVHFYSFQKGQRMQSILIHLLSSIIAIFLTATISKEVFAPLLKTESTRPPHLTRTPDNSESPPPRGPRRGGRDRAPGAVSYTHLRAHETSLRQRQMCIRDSTGRPRGSRPQPSSKECQQHNYRSSTVAPRLLGSCYPSMFSCHHTGP